MSGETGATGGRTRILLCAGLTAVLLAACASSPQRGPPASQAPSPTSSTDSSTAPSEEASSPPSATPELEKPSEAVLIEGSEAVTFRASDGVRLAGRIFGDGSLGVVLSHMGPQGLDQSGWWWMASLLAQRGYTVLTYNFRGNCPGGIYGCSQGESNPFDTIPDLRGAVAFLRSRDVELLVLGGASIGAMASLTEAAEGVRDLRGLVSLSGIELGGGFDIGPEVIRRIEVPTLFVAGRDDQEAADAARVWGRAAAEPTQTVIMPTGAHGTELFDDPFFSERTRELILQFVERHL